MFGRIRASSSAPESLERPPSKIFKADSLSIYEATLAKLKLGSQRELRSPSEQTEHVEMDSDSSSSAAWTASNSKSSQDTVIFPHTQCSSRAGLPGSVDSHSTSSTKEYGNRNHSVIYLFSKFKNSREVVCSSSEGSMPIEDGCSASVLTSSSAYKFPGSMELQIDQECFCSLPISHW
ncbi:hypothetical protein I3842_11G011200 [Carya illinoinensis]|uniref:Uncharacterized protein n=1 Tax=Carya illinoinensis TaxID=32201 RepID=A0A922DKS1_CARIL|nr:hypothetical protein I3842_11G011200 [Carya illinoinensis]